MNGSILWQDLGRGCIVTMTTLTGFLYDIITRMLLATIRMRDLYINDLHHFTYSQFPSRTHPRIMLCIISEIVQSVLARGLWHTYNDDILYNQSWIKISIGH